jgi:hypothetical protein
MARRLAILLCLLAPAAAQAADGAAVFMPDQLALADVVSGKARFGAGCVSDCFVEAELRLHQRIAYRLGLKDPVVGHGGGDITGPAVEALPIRLNARGHNRLTGRRGATVFAHVRITDAVGTLLAEAWKPVYLAR